MRRRQRWRLGAVGQQQIGLCCNSANIVAVLEQLSSVFTGRVMFIGPCPVANLFVRCCHLRSTEPSFTEASGSHVVLQTTNDSTSPVKVVCSTRISAGFELLPSQHMFVKSFFRKRCLMTGAHRTSEQFDSRDTWHSSAASCCNSRITARR